MVKEAEPYKTDILICTTATESNISCGIHGRTVLSYNGSRFLLPKKQRR